MAIRKTRGRRKTTRSRTRSRKTTTSPNPSRSLTRRRSRRGSVVARSRRRGVARRPNPSGKLVPLVLGAGVAQIVASLLPFNFGGAIGEAAKVFGVGWALEKFGGRAVPMLFGEAREGGAIAAGVLLFNAYLAPTVRGAVSSVLPSGKGVNGIAVTPYPISPGMPPMINPAQVAAARPGVNGMATAPRMR